MYVVSYSVISYQLSVISYQLIPTYDLRLTTSQFMVLDIMEMLNGGLE
ncbi:hypothetical protein [Scytonema millei]|uniref:Uncharacterized protein n=1 Tax=Scytonema millei VB511283 TaxID=1245923 RepID=A0A9X5I8T1_9CYAN|nr:hypothetical protein [Scytonema millei]NHC38072.1 hypothetical protein [Scytonema millei VB511283]